MSYFLISGNIGVKSLVQVYFSIQDNGATEMHSDVMYSVIDFC